MQTSKAAIYTYTGSVITNVNSWTDGSNFPATFANPGDTWIFDGSVVAAASLNSVWGIDASATVQLTGPFTLTYASGASIGNAFLVMNSGSVLILNTNHNFLSSNTTFNAGSQVVYATGTSSLIADQYSNLDINGNISVNAANVTIQGSFTIKDSRTLSLENGGVLNINGSFSTLSSPNSGQISTGSGSGDINIGGVGSFVYIRCFNANINNFTVNSSRLIFSVGTLTVSNHFNISSGTWALEGSSTQLILNGQITFGPAFQLRGSSCRVFINGSGAINGTLNMFQINDNFRTLRTLSMNRLGETLNIGSSLRILESINPTSGTINSNGFIRLVSSQSSKARVGALGPNGFLTGNLIVEVFKPADVTGWVNLCSWGVTGKTFADWNAQFAITCPSGCPNGSQVAGQPFTSVYSYNETTTSSDENDPSHYIPLAGTSTGIDSKAGYWVYLGNGFPNSSAMTLTLSGTVNTKGSSGAISLTRTGTAGSTTGWNLIANPYPSPISVASFIAAAGASNIDLNSITAYNATNGSSVLYTTGSNTAIPMGQAFYVRALNPVSFTPDESWKTATADPTSIQKINPASQAISPNGTPYYFNDFLIDLESQALPKPFFTQAYFTFGNAYTTGFDNGGDAYSMYDPIDPGTPRLFSFSNSEKFMRNALPALSGSLSIPLQVRTGYAGQYTLRPVNLSKLPSGACVILHDLLNNTNHDLRSGAYTTTILANQNNPQFELIITVQAANLSAQVSEPLCKNSFDGQIVASGAGSGPWNYTWKDINDYTLAYAPNVSGPHTLSGLGEGVYKVEVNTVGTCEHAVSEYTLNALTALPLSQFFSNAPLTGIEAEVPVSFSNISQNASEFTWDFGDGGSVSSLHATHAFAAPGVYTVKLLVNNGTCQDTDESSQEILVLPTVVGIGQYSFKDEELSLVQDAGNLYLQIGDQEKEFAVSAYNLLGQELMKEDIFKAVDGKIIIPVKRSENLIFVKVSSGEKSKTFKVVY